MWVGSAIKLERAEMSAYMALHDSPELIPSLRNLPMDGLPRYSHEKSVTASDTK